MDGLQFVKLKLSASGLKNISNKSFTYLAQVYSIFSSNIFQIHWINFFFSNLEEEKTKMEPGEITFDFSFTLPIEIPSSYSDRYGTIEYFAKVVVDRPWAINIKSKKHFIVRNYMTLNNIPSGMVRFILLELYIFLCRY